MTIPHNTPPIPGAPTRIPGTPSSVPHNGSIGSSSGVHLHDMQGRFTKNGFGYAWQNLQELIDLPEEFGAEILQAADVHFKKLAEEVQAYAQENAPWQDNTGDARAGLKALYLRKKDVYEIDLGHSVDYGYYLEHSNGGAFAIVAPTIEHFSREMTNISDEMSKGLSFGIANPLPGALQ